MIKFKKVLSVRSISLILAVVFSMPTTAYGTNLSNRSHLRPPPATSSSEGRERLKETLSEVTYHEHVNKHINPQAKVLYKAFLQSKEIDLSLADNPENIALFYNSLGKYKDSEIAIMEIAGLYENTRILEHIGLGRFYGRPIIYIDKSLKGKEREEILQHAYDEITGWAKERNRQGVEWGKMRDLILANYQEFQTIAASIHSKSYNINDILEKYRADHKSDLLTIIASMPFKEGDVVIAAGRDNPPSERELVAAIRADDDAFLQKAVPLLFKATREALQNNQVDEAHDLCTQLDGVLNALASVEGQFPEVDGLKQEARTLFEELRRQHKARTAAGSPQAVFNLLSKGQTLTRQEIADALDRKVRTIQPDLRFLVSAGLLIQEGRVGKATYVINPELSKNPALIARIQNILDAEFKVLKTGLKNKAKIGRMIFKELTLNKIISLIMANLRGKKLGPFYVAEQLRINIDAAERALELLVEEGTLVKDGNNYYWAVSGGSGKEAPESLKQEYLKVAAEYHKATVRLGKITLSLWSNMALTPEEKREALAKEEAKEGIEEVIAQFDSLKARLEQYAPPAGYENWFGWGINQLDRLKGSPQAAFNLQSDGKTRTRQQVADALGRSILTIEPDLRFLVSVGLLIQKSRGEKATYVISPELSNNPDLIVKIQQILNEEFKILKTGWENKAKIREMIFEEALKDVLHLAPVLEKYKTMREVRDEV